MRQKIIFLLFFNGLSQTIVAQPVLNQWYDFGRTQSVYSNVIATDSCYYSIGMAASDVVSATWDMIFTKTNLDGSLSFTNFIHNDTISINSFYSNLLPTYDNQFMTVIDYDQFFMFIKYSPDGDTLFTSIIEDILVNENYECVYPTAFIEMPDSTYTGLLCIDDVDTWEVRIALVNLSKTGELNFYKMYNINQFGYTLTYPRSLIKTSDGYLISCDIIKSGGGSPINDSQRVRFIKTDNAGNELWRWTDMDHPLDAMPFGLTPTPDDGYLYGGVTGWYNSFYNGHYYLGHIVKLDSNLNQNWEIKMGDSTGVSYINFSQILPTNNDRYVATGFCTKDTMTIGWLINFDLNGQVHWDSYFSYVPGETAVYDPWHELYDVEQTPDKGFVMVGNAWDQDATSAGNPGKFAWLVKTDSVGCLVPGCQDFFSVEEHETLQIKLGLYPNPAADILNIYFYDETFGGKATIQVFDIQGNLIREWPVHTNDITFIYDVSLLPSGAYVLKVVEGGVEKAAQKFVVE